MHTSQQQSSLVQSSAVQSSAMRNCLAQSRPVPSSPEQLTAVESSTTQSCSVKEKPSALRPVHSSQVLFGKVHIEAHTSAVTEWVFFFDLIASDILTFCSSRQTHFTRLSITEKVSKELLQCNFCNMGSLADRKTLMRCIKQL